MKKLLITGANSYVGTSVEKHLKQWPQQYQVDTLDMLDGSWKEASFAGYDAVFHVAGIVHLEQAKNDPAQAELYDRVNARLPAEVAQKARAEGVKQFLFMSSASVYGLSAPVGKVVTITRDTPLKPVDNYGISKKKAEELLLPLSGDGFKIVVLRPPMIYGKGCKGNYNAMAKLAKKLPVFPDVANQRSMLYIENLAEFVRLLLEDDAEGIFCPQNNEYTNTSEMVKMIAQVHDKRVIMIRGLNWALKLTSHMTGLVNKAFGSLCYEQDMSQYGFDYCRFTLEQSIRETEK